VPSQLAPRLDLALVLLESNVRSSVADLLVMAKTWDLIAGRIGRAPHSGERPAVSEATFSKWPPR
jgi:hypothetical protein